MNLKQIRLAFRVWDPSQIHEFQHRFLPKWAALRSWLPLVATAVFQLISNELNNTKILTCYADAEHHPATNWTTDFGNKNISYFVGLDASEDDPDSILTGDDNFAINGARAKSGVFQLTTNTPIAWTAGRHKLGGNIGLADGSVQFATNSELKIAITKQFQSEFLKPSQFTNVAPNRSIFGKTNQFRIAIP